MKQRFYSFLLVLLGLCGIIYIDRKMINRRNEQLNNAIKQKELLDRWLTMKEQGISVDKYLRENNLKSVGIYGMGLMGSHLYEDLRKSNFVERLIGIDRAEIHDNYDISIKKPEDNLDELDIIIITVTSGYQAVEEQLKTHFKGEIASLDKIMSKCEDYYVYEI